jgi:hypothetical protein
MIIRHSKKILEQLTEIESLIQKFETYMDRSEIDIDRESILLKLIKAREVQSTSPDKKN